MKVEELFEGSKQLTRAEKDARRAAAVDRRKQEFIRKIRGNTEEDFVELPVLLAGKWVKRSFIIDNTHEMHTKVSDLKLIDMGQIESNPREREEYEGAVKYSIYNGREKYDTNSVPKYLHGLPARTKHLDPKNPEDLRRQVYQE